ncbi:dicarboxylate/amino acid:cation symporter [Anatilimnocola floriformis]|uniref:dicarboxylate/amino acid:cation symporter n=1 Tax=Anatilimnocola floriformis TaxID=2948575 RepID=UPI0020C410A0|nr:dicarboxylate/amino acid:cation symporter [Anatilimnocola floriformis]
MNECPPKPEPKSSFSWSPLGWPLPVRVVLGVTLGAIIGFYAGDRDIRYGWTTAHLGEIAKLYIQLLTALATPLIFFAVIEAFVKTQISGAQGLKMFVVCAVNIAFAFAVGLLILNVFKPGLSWRKDLTEALQKEKDKEKEKDKTAASEKAQPGKGPSISDDAKKVSLSPLEILKSYIPKSVLQPFSENMVLTVAVLAILIGAALRSLKHADDPELLPSLVVFEHLIVAIYQIIIKMLMWLIELAPYAICFAVAGVVGSTGLKAFKQVGVFFLTTTVALSIHAFIYYPLTAWLIGGKSPLRYFSEGIGAILTGFSLNSSLATAPLTLQALERLQVSESSARLSACVGTNFNNDGITLYEAMTALFIAQAAGMELTIAQQITILLAALAGSMGIAGIPNSGLIILTLVLKAAQLPDEVVNYALPIVYSIDFIIARLRSAVNVMGDLQVAILLDAGQQQGMPPQE